MNQEKQETNREGSIVHLQIFYDPATGDVSMSGNADLGVMIGILEMASEIARENVRANVREAFAAQKVRQMPGIALPKRG